MNKKASEKDHTIELQDLLTSWVNYGVALFIRTTEVDAVACNRLVAMQDALQEDNKLDKSMAGTEWPNFCEWVQEELRKDTGPVNKLCHNFELDLADVFLLSLLGGIELNNVLSMAIKELQEPENSFRPSVNLITSICDVLFQQHKIDSIKISESILFQSHIIQLEGNGPVVTQNLVIDQNFWRALFSGVLSWSGIMTIDEKDFELFPDDESQSISLQYSAELTHFLLKGDSDNNAIYAAKISSLWGKQAIQIDLVLWQQTPALRLAAELTSCVPIIALPDSEQPIPLPTTQYNGPVFLLGASESLIVAKNLLEVKVPVLTSSQRLSIWQKILKDHSKLADEFRHVHINGPQIKRLIKQAGHLVDSSKEQSVLSVRHLRQAWSMISSESLITLAQNVDRNVPQKALVLPSDLHTQLDDFILRCKQRDALWEGLGVTASSSVNHGVRALFVGDSGTGKTLAASYLATTMGMPLYRVDISSIMNKYVGESEKNLNRLFNYASRFDVMLLLDEADALFGRRGDQDDSGARFGNMLTNFLLTRIESYSGIVILTSNSRSRIDPAFIRRLESIIEFPRPEFTERLGIWNSHLGDRNQDQEICRRLASYCELPGGSIRNAVLFAAARNRDIKAIDLLDGLDAEYKKLGKTLPIELQKWQRVEREIITCVEPDNQKITANKIAVDVC